MTRDYTFVVIMKSHLARSPCGKVMKDEIFNVSRSFRRHRSRLGVRSARMDEV